MKYALLIVLLLAGCASVPADPVKMSPEQLAAWAKDRNATVSCVSVQTLAYDIVTTWVVLDRDAVRVGGVTVGPDCAVMIQSGAKP